MKVKKTTYQSSSSKNNEIIKLTNEIKNAIQKTDENNHLKKRNEQLEQYIIKEERKKQKKV